MYFVYILYSSSKDKYYIGQTQDLQERVNTHNIRKNLGTNDWQLKYSEEYNTRSEAMLRETEIKKKKSRKYIELLISSAGYSVPSASGGYGKVSATSCGINSGSTPVFSTL